MSEQNNNDDAVVLPPEADLQTLLPLPIYAGEALAEMTDDELIALMIGDEDRVPRNVINEAARRDSMVGALQRRLDLVTPVDATAGEWWLTVHAAMIWGLMPGLAAGEAQIDLMQHLSDEDEVDLDDWLAEAWPHLVVNKPAAILERLRRIANQRSSELFLRINAIRCVVVMQGEKGELEQSLDWVASLAGDGGESQEFRLLAASQLLDFPRERHRRLLQNLAKRDQGEIKIFDIPEIDAAFESDDDPEWTQHERAWGFYEPEAIRSRQQRWASEDNELEDGDEYGATPETYVRESPKIGRNDPCPCGSGKKYKKCCLEADEAMQRNLQRDDPY